jgi:ABC-2 type transport system ATP-binding protein
MNSNTVFEISKQLDSDNYILGFRRFLDLCLDSPLNISEKEKVLKLCDAINIAQDSDTQPSADTISQIKEMTQTLSNLNTASSEEVEDVVDAKELSKTYLSGHFQLKPINITIRPGELIGVVGENGNGKTTLLRMIASDLSNDTGHISYGDSRYEYTTLYDIKRGVAYIPQRIPRWYGKLVNNLHFAASSRGIYGFENEYLVKIVITRLGLNKYKNLFWTEISSGYRTRFELARILLLQPKLLILDEPLANLDINAQQTFLQDLRNLGKSKTQPLGILFSSQQLHEVEKVSDHIIFLRKGESVFNSTTDDRTVLETHTEIEIETTATRDQLLGILKAYSDITIHLHGGMYVIRCSVETSPDAILKDLVLNDVPIAYFRNLTHSTKKFFNQN